MRRALMVVGLGLALLAPSRAHADNTTAANANFVMLGEIHTGNHDSTTSERWYKVNLVAGRSYAASAWAPATDPSEAPVNLVISWFLNNGTSAAAGVDATDREPIPVTTDHTGDNSSIIPTTGDCAPASGCTYRIRVQAVGATATMVPVSFMVVETTMVSPYWAVATASGYDAAPQIRNNTSSTISVTFTAYGQTGAVICSNTFTIPANGMTTFGISGAAPGCSIASGFGSAQVAHHGPPGSIAANITTFSGISGLSFDAPFYPRNTWTSLGGN